MAPGAVTLLATLRRGGRHLVPCEGLWPLVLLTALCGWWAAVCCLARDREDASGGKRRCSYPPGGLSWLPVAKVTTGVVPPGSRASASMNQFMCALLPGALVVGSFGL